MTAAAFTEAVEKMSGLKPETIRHLTDLAPKLSDEDRERTIAQLQTIHAEIEKETTELLADLDEGDRQVHDIEHKVLPALRAQAEKDERQEAENIFGTQTSDDLPPAKDA